MLNARRLTTLIALMTLAALGACTPVEETPTGPKPPTDEPKVTAPVSEDITLTGFDPAVIKGMVYRPEGLGKPNVVRVSAKKPTTLAKQRKKWASAKGAAKATEAKVLVSMLWDAGTAQSDETVNALRAEAKQVLADTKAAAPEEFDDLLYRMLFTLQVWTDEEAAAVATGTEMVEKFPESAITDALAPWIAYLQLRANMVDAAQKTVSRWQLEGLDPNSDYARAYAMAWAAFRAGDYETAPKAIAWAAKNWKSPTTVPVVVQDLLLMFARAGLPIDQAMTYFTDLSNGSVDVQYEWLYKLYEGLEAAGRPELAAAALQKALDIKGAAVPPLHLVSISQRQFNNYLIAHEPEKAANKLLDAYNGIGPCGELCAGNTDAMADQIKQLAQHFHTTFATTQDPKFYGPAEKLYQFYIGLQRPDSAEMQSNLTALQETKARMVANTGVHDKATMGWSIGVRNPTVKACYEKVLQSEPTLAGELALTLEIAADGTVSGANTNPPAGDQGLAAVAKCVDERARTWTFPARSKPGKTTLTQNYKLAPQQ